MASVPRLTRVIFASINAITICKYFNSRVFFCIRVLIHVGIYMWKLFFLIFDFTISFWPCKIPRIIQPLTSTMTLNQQNDTKTGISSQNHIKRGITFVVDVIKNNDLEIDLWPWSWPWIIKIISEMELRLKNTQNRGITLVPSFILKNPTYLTLNLTLKLTLNHQNNIKNRTVVKNYTKLRYYTCS